VEPRLASAAAKTGGLSRTREVLGDAVVLPLDLVDVRDRLVLTHRRLHRLVLKHCTSIADTSASCDEPLSTLKLQLL
jgi:hypothetical protein